ncbi:hypothetical protein [Legionella pneumophila]|uniref:hypothetical protein n=1 Tax=Legionella pneumophila TaxID=446 RepID=UPI00399D4AF9
MWVDFWLVAIKLGQIRALFAGRVVYDCERLHLEDYFVFKELRYQGPKKAFKYLEAHDPETLSLFDEAITNIDNLDALNRLITRVIKIDKT